MNNDIREKLEDEIGSTIDAISVMQTGSEKHSDAVDSLTKLYKLKLEEDKLENEKAEKALELKDKSTERKLRVGETIVKIALGGACIVAGFVFETTDSFTSQTFKECVNKVVPALWK